MTETKKEKLRCLCSAQDVAAVFDSATNVSDGSVCLKFRSAGRVPEGEKLESDLCF